MDAEFINGVAGSGKTSSLPNDSNTLIISNQVHTFEKIKKQSPQCLLKTTYNLINIHNKLEHIDNVIVDEFNMYFIEDLALILPPCNNLKLIGDLQQNTPVGSDHDLSVYGLTMFENISIHPDYKKKQKWWRH
jgi:hypothetical protein